MTPSSTGTVEDLATTEPVDRVMVRRPKTLPADASLTWAQDAFQDDHVHMLLLTRAGRLLGTLVRDDLPPPGTQGAALSWAMLAGRTVPPQATVAEVRQLLEGLGARRAAVTAADGTLLGLVCLNRRRTGFCSDAGVTSRRRGQARHG